jgi:hypothetical protein
MLQIILSISMLLNHKPIKGRTTDRRRLLLEFPTRPNTVCELRFLRYWLHQLSRAHFTVGKFLPRYTCMNTLFVQELFPDKENIHFSFGTLEVGWSKNTIDLIL